ncbi:RusA family crossover junction endodeoxyribonuclease [Clostridium sporogenes]|uniref:RusA family crossover junction endodeoxyribonuclease n=1 Tax=Clostridium sporogenes TaxID=1509 RepID=UPI003C2CEBAD
MLGIVRPTIKPDVDNIAKVILDSLNGLAYKDDKQIVTCGISKWYGEDPRVEVILEEA